MSYAHRQIKSNRYHGQGHVDDYGTTKQEEAVAQMHNRQSGHDRDANLLRLIAREGGDPAQYAKQHGGPLPKVDRPPCAVPGCPKAAFVRLVCDMHYARVRKQRGNWREIAPYIAPPRGGK